MSIVEPEFAPWCDPQLAAQLADHATGALPVWLWSADGSRILWANAVGAAIFGAANTSECAARQFHLKHPAAAEIARLSATLSSAGQARLERLRGFGASFGRALTCVCSRTSSADGAPAILVAAAEPAGPNLTLRERVSRLFPDGERRLAIFAPDGTQLYLTEAARTRIAGTATLSSLGIAGIAHQALTTGSAGDATEHGPVTIERLGCEASTVLAVTFAALPSAGQTAGSAPAKIELAIAATLPQARAEAPPPLAQAARGAAPDEPIAERRHPLRFVWQMDADGRFVVGSDEFTELMGPRTTAAFGRLWSEIAAELKLDPDNQVARAVATHETWSGVTVSWPVDEGGERLPVELSGLPVFDREREFRGYRGFGVCRDIARINQLARVRRERPIGFMAQPEAPAEDHDASAAPVPAAEAETKTPAASPTAGEAATELAPRIERPAASAVPAAANVVPFRPGAPPEPKAPSLSPVERRAFRELAQELTARLRGGREASAAESIAGGLAAKAETTPAALAETAPAPPDAEALPQIPGAERQGTEAPPQGLPVFELALLDRIPAGVLVYRHDSYLYFQHDSLLYANRHFLELTGYPSVDVLAAAGGLNALIAAPDAGAPDQSGGAQSVCLITSGGGRRQVEGRLFTIPWGGASALALIVTGGEGDEKRQAATLALATAENQVRQLTAKLESFKQSEEELRGATREAQKAAAAKADFIGKVSHEIRTPLNAITGFTEVIMAERFGPIGNERYREYLKDMQAAETHLVALLNDLLDLSKIETGQLDLTFANVSLNELTQQCVGIMQPQASRARIIIRTSLTPGIPQVVADERSLRQIVLNLLSNSIKFTGPGGQVIVSTAFADSGEAVLRVRDTGVGMSEKDVEAALEPFRQTATSGSWGSGGTGLGLPLTKALAEANRAHFSIKSAPNAGTLIEVAFPPTRVVAQ